MKYAWYIGTYVVFSWDACLRYNYVSRKHNQGQRAAVLGRWLCNLLATRLGHEMRRLGNYCTAVGRLAEFSRTTMSLLSRSSGSANILMEEPLPSATYREVYQPG